MHQIRIPLGLRPKQTRRSSRHPQLDLRGLLLKRGRESDGRGRQSKGEGRGEERRWRKGFGPPKKFWRGASYLAELLYTKCNHCDVLCNNVGAAEDVIMNKSGKFDVTDDTTPGHVTYSQPIIKSLLHFRPVKLFRRPDRQPIIEDVDASSLTIGSDVTTPISETENIVHNHLSINASEFQPQPAAPAVSKSGREFQPEVKKYRRFQSCEPTGSLRDRWRLLNDEFKQLYQQRSKSPSATTSQGQGQGQTNVPKVNKFKDIDRRFSKVSRAVGNMSARQLHNTASGRPAVKPEVTSSEEKAAVFLPTTNDGEDSERIPETEEEFLSSDDPNRYLFSADSTFASVPHQGALSEEHSGIYPAYVQDLSPTELIGWYPDHQATSHNDQRPSSSLYIRDRKEETTQQTTVLPPTECGYKRACKHCGMAITSSSADDDDDDDDDDDVRSQTVNSPHGTPSEGNHRTVIMFCC